ncbi:MAG TPA: ATP-binding cassette domain-containing protein [Actinomycetota bacterium]|nr:ATP-binding cassette domain-containing protein [Actinomycetota bacterium]
MSTTAATMAPPLLALRDVAKTYRRGPELVHALRGVTFDVRPGELVGLVGPSGSGKTTVLNVVAGWEPPDEGAVEWRSVGQTPPLGWRSIAIVPQDLALLEELPVAENVALPMRLDPTLSPVMPLLDLAASLGFEDLAERMPSDISLGEQQRVAIARALVAGPELLLADEPTAHQDEVSTKRVLSAIRVAVDRGMAALVSTHSPEVIEALDRVLPIRDGRIASR